VCDAAVDVVHDVVVDVVNVVCDVVRDVVGTERRGRDGALPSICRTFENPNVSPQPSSWKGGRGTPRGAIRSRHEVRVL
jgi:hypothetical protein